MRQDRRPRYEKHPAFLFDPFRSRPTAFGSRPAYLPHFEPEAARDDRPGGETRRFDPTGRPPLEP